MIVGFDGATLDLIRPWAEAGHLPTFQRMIREGTWGQLQSSMPPVTPAAWSTLATGMNQGKHGLFDFFARKEGSYENVVVNATHRHGAPLWKLLSRAGRRVTVFNVPASYPPDPVNGLMVSGLLTPSHATDAAWPLSLMDELKRAVPEFSFYPPGVFSRGQESAFVQEVLAWDEMTSRATEFLRNRQEWDFLFTVFIGVDIVSHFLWRHMASQEPLVGTNDKAARDTPAKAILSVYQQADRILAQLLSVAGEDTYVMVISDHGFGPLDHYMHLNAWLVEQGYLVFKRMPAVLMKALAYRLGFTPLHVLELLRAFKLGGRVQKTARERNAWLKTLVRRTFLSLDDIDWTRTTAYSAGYGAPIYLNRRGRLPEGIVEPGVQYEALLERLVTDLREVHHPLTGEPYFGEIYRPRDLYHGPYTDLAPDLLPLPRDWRNQGYGVHDFASNRWLEPSPDRTGTHRMNGIFFLRGPGVRADYELEGALLQDIAPTVLALMDVPIPTNMDGRVLKEVLNEQAQGKLSLEFAEPEAEEPGEGPIPELVPEEEQLIRDRLEALGYGG